MNTINNLVGSPTDLFMEAKVIQGYDSSDKL